MNISMDIVEALTIKVRKDGTEIRGYCSVCGCNDCGYSLEKLCWHCLHCNAVGTIDGNNGYQLQDTPLPTFDIPAIRKIYFVLAEEYHNNLSNPILAYLKGRGLLESTIEKFKIGFCLGGQKLKIYDDKNAKDAGVFRDEYPILSNRLVIPYIYNEEVTDLRGRTLPEIFKYKENTPRYISLEGSYAARGADYFFNHNIVNTSDTVIITEGEFKAIVAAQYGFPIVATPGITKWNNDWDELLKNKKVVLAADNEFVVGRRSPCYVQAKFLMKHIPHLEVARLPRNSKNNKVDVDSLILNKGIEHLKCAIEVAQPVEEFLEQEKGKRYGRRK
jgi:DNA primase